MAAAARLPWLSRGAGGSQTELESVSSHSLLHSIYGSQVSQVLLASSDSNTNLADSHSANDRRLIRPKSSPATSSLKREKRNLAVPPSQRQVRTRPATAYARGSGPTNVLSRRPTSALTVSWILCRRSCMSVGVCCSAAPPRH